MIISILKIDCETTEAENVFDLFDCSTMIHPYMFSHCLWCHLCVSSFWLFPIFLFPRPIRAFYADIPALYPEIPCYIFLRVVLRAVCE